MFITPQTPEPDHPIDPMSLWMALLHDSQRPCALIDGNGVIRQCNTAYAVRMQHQTPESIIGRRLDHIAPHKAAVERIDAIRHAIASGQPIVFIGKVLGVETTSVIRPVLPARGADPGLALVMCHVPTDHQWLAEVSPTYQVIRSDEQLCADLLPPDRARGI